MSIDPRHLDARLRAHSALRLLRAGLPRGSALAWDALGHAVRKGFEAETLGLLGREVNRARLNDADVADAANKALADHPGLENVLETWRRSAADADEAAPHYADEMAAAASAALEDLEAALDERGAETVGADLAAGGADMNLAVVVEDALRDEEGEAFGLALLAINPGLDAITRGALAVSWLAPLLEEAEEETRERVVDALVEAAAEPAGRALIASLSRGDMDDDCWRRLQDASS